MDKEAFSLLLRRTAELNDFRDAYYNKNLSLVSDEVYDRLFDELVRLENETGIRMANSPTQTVGYPVVTNLKKVHHEIPLLSLPKTKDVQELLGFADGHRMNLSMKLDGLTTKLVYENGTLVQAATRGDGEVGEDVTHNACAISGIPQTIPYIEKLVVVGESFIPRSDFSVLREQLRDSNGEPYRNGRNLAAGAVRALDSAACRQRMVCFLPFAVLEGLSELEKETDSKLVRLRKLREFGFGRIKTIQFTGGTTDMLEMHIEVLQKKADEDDLPIDGMVLSFDEISFSKNCGRTGHHFKDGMAFKFPDGFHQTTLLDIEWTTARSGVVTPVAVFNEVEIDGCRVSRALLSNLSIVESLELVPGCRILVSKRNQIIPHIEDNLDRGLTKKEIWDFSQLPEQYVERWKENMRLCMKHIEIGECDGEYKSKHNPNKRPCAVCVKRRAKEIGILNNEHSFYPECCPCCGQPTRVRQTGSGSRITRSVVCDNPQCASRNLRRFVHFVGDKAMDIRGLSEVTLEKFIGYGWLHTCQDIYQLDKYKDKVIQMEGFGEKSWIKLWTAIQESLNTTFVRILVAMDIPMVGRTASRQLSRRFDSDLQKFLEAVNSGYDFTEIPGIGEILNGNIRSWFQDENNMRMWEAMVNMANIEREEGSGTVGEKDNPFNGCTMVVTGKVEPYTRSGINLKIESLGAHAASSVTKKTDYLVCGENAGSKLDKARELGITILTPAEFFEMIGE